MSDTIVDLPKLCQMLDNGWTVQVWKNDLGTYTAHGIHHDLETWQRAKDGVLAVMVAAGWTESEARHVNDADFDAELEIDTDDFTPEQALTRLAYKVHGEIL
jgi:hypothetical protein